MNDGRLSPYRDAEGPDDPTKNRITLIKFLVICMPLWLSLHYFNGPQAELINIYISAILLLIVASLIIQIAVPRLREKQVLLGCSVVLSGIELLAGQIPAIGAPLSGTTLFGDFSINKIPYYGVGGFIGFFILQACRIHKR